MTAWLDTFFFGLYPFFCLAVFFIGSWVRYDLFHYNWKRE